MPSRRFTLRRRTGRVTVRLAEPYCRCRGYEISATFRQGPERFTLAWRLPALR